MNHIVVSVVAALAVSIATYGATGSLWTSFLAYVGTGTTVLLMALLSGYLDVLDDKGQDDT